MLRFFLFIAFALALFSSCALEYPNERHWFMPPNDLARYDSLQQPNITESEFNSILDEIEKVYTPIISAFGAKFQLERDWADSTVNAYAEQVGKTYIVHMYGGMARRTEMNVAGFGLVACHEIGHHLGGFPKYADSSWASNEGNSDYWANFVCAPKVFTKLPVPTVPEIGKTKCDAAWSENSQREACYKSLDGGLALGGLLAVLGGQKPPQYDTPDLTVVTKTSDKHPKAQCRVDTYLAGSLCVKQFNDAVIPKDEFAFCDTRPKCWFKSSGGGGDPDPNPDPDPDPNPDPTNPKTEIVVNDYRNMKNIPKLVHDEALFCAAFSHAADIGKTNRCSHRGSDGSNVAQRLRNCGYTKFAMEMVACRTDSPDRAVWLWYSDRANRQILLSRYASRVGCADINGFYVCLVGQ